ncbi:MAG: hypothetical protein Q7R76_06780 [Candidatus Woesearchaeota archaeon]|nr:hypothetical protein [Candidatus Woesearchaeota archaeon]
MGKERGDGNTILLVVLLLILAGMFSFAPSSFLPTGLLSLNLQLNQNIGDEYRTITQETWDGLADGVIYADGKTTYSQNIVFRDQASSDPIEACSVIFGRNNEGETSNFLHCKKGDDLFEYRVSFSSGLQSTIDDHNQLKDIDDEKLFLLGQEFTVTQAVVTGNNLRLRLSGGAVTKTIEEGKSETLLIDGVQYTVTVVTISNDATPRVVLNINGQTSKPLEAKKLIILNNGVHILINTLLTNEAGEGGVGDHVILAFGGARSVILEDTDYTDDKFTTGSVVVNSQQINDGKIKIRAVKTGNHFTIDSIAYRLRAADMTNGDVYVASGSSIMAHLRNPLGLLSSVWDIRYGGLGTLGVARPVSGSMVKFDASGSGYRLLFTNNAGLSFTVPLLTITGGNLRYGTDRNDLIFTEGANASDYNIDENDYFIVTSRSDEGKGTTHVLQFESISGQNAVFTDLSTGTKSVPLFPTGAFASLFDDYVGLNRIKVPLETLIGFQTAEGDVKKESTPSEPVSLPAPEPIPVAEPSPPAVPEPEPAVEPSPAPVAEPALAPPEPVPPVVEPDPVLDNKGGYFGTPEENAARQQQIEAEIQQEKFKQQCDQNLRIIETDLGNMVGDIGVTERNGELFMTLWGANTFSLCSEFFNFLVVEKAFPWSSQAIQAEIARCKNSVNIPPGLQQCTNYQQMLGAVNRLCNELGEKLGDMNAMQERLLSEYKNKCLPKLQQDIDTWNAAHGMGPAQLPGGEVSPPATSPSLTPPSSTTTPPALDSSPQTPPDTSPNDTFTCCEYCPSLADGTRFYFPLEGGNCESSADAVRTDLTRETCVNPLYEIPPPSTYGPACPSKTDLDQKDKQKKCDEAKQSYLALKAEYESVVPQVRTAWDAYQASGYKDAAAKSQYDDVYRQAHDVYFNKMIPARDEAKKLCDGVVPDAPVEPVQESAPAPSANTSANTSILKNENFRNAESTPLHEMADEQLKSVSNLKLTVPGKGGVHFLEPIDARGIDFDSTVKISSGTVTVDVVAVPELNKPAILTIENLALKNPSLLADGSICRQCKDVRYKDNTLTFSVEHFTTFSAVEAGGKKGTLMVGGQSYTFFVNTDNNRVVVDQNADGTLDSSSVNINVAGNGVLELGGAGGTVDVVLRTPKRYLENRTEDETTTIRVAVSGSAAGITLPNLNTTYNKAAKTVEGMTTYGALFVLGSSRDTHNDLIITYPTSQRMAGVNVRTS